MLMARRAVRNIQSVLQVRLVSQQPNLPKQVLDSLILSQEHAACAKAPLFAERVGHQLTLASVWEEALAWYSLAMEMAVASEGEAVQSAARTRVRMLR